MWFLMVRGNLLYFNLYPDLLDKMLSRGPFQLHPACDSVALKKDTIYYGAKHEKDKK